MKIFKYHVYWRFSNENFCHGIVWANNENDAKRKLNIEYPNNIGIDISELNVPENGIEEIYGK